jgi:type IV secretion system protein TrbL
MSSTILTDIVRDYEAISTLWFSALSPIAQRIFWTLVAIQLTWSAMWWALDREDGLGALSSLLRQVVAIGFFYALLVNGATWIPAVTQSFSQAGATAAGIPDLSPSGVFDQGLALANRILNSTADKGLLDKFFASLVASVTALIVVVAFAIIAAQLLVVLVESFIVVGAGVLFLGFAGSQWTRFFTERYLSYIASVGVRLFVLYLIMGVGMDIAARWMSILERGGFSPIPFFYVMGGSLVFVFLTWHIPSVAGSLMAGAVSLSLADAVHPAILGSRAAGAGLATLGAVGAPAVSGVRWGVDRLRGHASLHTVNGDSPRAQPPGTGASAPPASDVNQARSPGKPEPERPKALQPAGNTRDPDVSTSDRSTPLGGREPE